MLGLKFARNLVMCVVGISEACVVCVCGVLKGCARAGAD